MTNTSDILLSLTAAADMTGMCAWYMATALGEKMKHWPLGVSVSQVTNIRHVLFMMYVSEQIYAMNHAAIINISTAVTMILIVLRCVKHYSFSSIEKWDYPSHMTQ